MKKYREIIETVAQKRLEGTIEILSPSQYNSELLKDYEQDLWLELYTLLSKKPKMAKPLIEEHLLNVYLPSLPDPRIIYTDNVETFLSKT